ncbi:MAG: translation elongation factor Ts [Fibrobacterales bacterium]
MAITAAQVKELREKTGVGMMQCKKALTEADGDIEKAIENLRKQGQAVAAKRAGKDANEGCVFVSASDTKAVAVEINCETDFVANGDDFQGAGKAISNLLLENDYADLAALMAAEINGESVEITLSSLTGKLGEKIDIKRYGVTAITDTNAVATYSHMGGKIGVIVNLSFEGSASDKVALIAVAKDLAMQVAATSPVAVNSDGVSQDVIDKEREIFKELAIQSGTKEEFLDRQIEGKLKKFLKEVCLSEQMFVKDSKLPVTKLLENLGKEQGVTNLVIESFTRFELGK